MTPTAEGADRRPPVPETEPGGQVLRPPEYAEAERPVIFLAGPVGGAPEWHAEAEAHLARLSPDVIVANPNTDFVDGDIPHDQRTDWESHHLRLAGAEGAVMFWLPKRAREVKEGKDYAQTSRFEIGEWMVRAAQGSSVTIGVEDGFFDGSYIRRRYAQECPDIEIQETLAETCAVAVAAAEARFVAVRGT